MLTRRTALRRKVAREALCRHLRAEGMAVRAVAERIAREHAELLRRLGE
ncbi:hypothetical protein ACFZAG_19535 [Streptomyces sp. NPDC012403]